MKSSRALWVLSSLCFVGAVVAASGACSGSSALPALPPGNAAFTGQTPATLGTACTDGDYAAVSGLTECQGQTTYLLCVDGTWSDYTCSDPSNVGWTASGDGGTSSGGDAGGVSDGGSAVDGGSAGDAGASDGGSAGDAGAGDGGSASDAGSPADSSAAG